MTAQVLHRPAPAFAAGARAMAPLLAGLAPVGFVVGATAAGAGVPPLAAIATAPLLFGASTQLVAIRLLGTGAAPAFVIVMVALVSARLMLYGAVMAPLWQDASARWKVLASAFIVEPTVALGAAHAETTPEGAARRSYFLGAAVTLWTGWLVVNAAGVLVGPHVGALVPTDPLRVLAFVALAVPAARATPATRAAAFSAALAAVAFAALPYGLGLLAAAAIGIVAGFIAEEHR
jgi:predicted branched-subunit amino acid permease